jgi:hypothetical protein
MVDFFVAHERAGGAAGILKPIASSVKRDARMILGNLGVEAQRDIMTRPSS